MVDPIVFCPIEAKVTPSSFFSFLLSTTSDYFTKTWFPIQSYLFDDIWITAVITDNSLFLSNNFNVLLVCSQCCFISLVIKIIRMNEYSYFYFLSESLLCGSLKKSHKKVWQWEDEILSVSSISLQRIIYKIRFLKFLT